MFARDFFEVLISYEFFSMTVLKVARKSIGERVNTAIKVTHVQVKLNDSSWPIL